MRNSILSSSRAITIIVALVIGCGTAPAPEGDGGVVPDSSTEMDAGGDAGMSVDLDGGSSITACAGDTDCDDMDSCDGVEHCGADHQCAIGDAPAEGTACTTATVADGVCRRGRCRLPLCGNGRLETGEECDDGNDVRADGCTPDCQYSCHDDTECVDGSVCNGDESCDGTMHHCVHTAHLDCADHTACTTDSCDDVAGCINVLVDADGDGHAANALGPCGSDCDDSNPDVYQGAPEVCDGIDNNCADGTSDEDVQTWYADCDGDGYARASATSMRSCARPSGSSCGGSGAWTARSPTGSAVDCNDDVVSRHPGATEVVDDGIDQNCDGGDLCYLDNDNDGYRTALLRISSDLDCSDSFEARASDPTGDCCEIDADAHPHDGVWFADQTACGGHDYDCDGVEERQFTAGGDLCQVGQWVDAAPPACGARAAYWEACSPHPTTATRSQACR